MQKHIGMRKKKIGVLAFQGDVMEHAAIIEKLGQRFLPVRTVNDLANVDALIIPGGESTTIGFFLEETGLMQAIRRRASAKIPYPMPIWGTCAGAILLAKKIVSTRMPPSLGLMDMTIERNAYGRQINSFYATLQIPRLQIANLEAAFIRAPIILNAGSSEILATLNKKIVLVRQGNLLASTFHPELTNDERLHRYFISTVFPRLS